MCNTKEIDTQTSNACFSFSITTFSFSVKYFTDLFQKSLWKLKKKMILFLIYLSELFNYLDHFISPSPPSLQTNIHQKYTSWHIYTFRNECVTVINKFVSSLVIITFQFQSVKLGKNVNYSSRLLRWCYRRLHEDITQGIAGITSYKSLKFPWCILEA